MKIAWFTPFAGGCMMARFSAIVTRELSRHADVDIWHPPAPALEASALRTIAMPRGIRVSPAMLEAYDFAVYNLGDDDSGRIAKAACAAPGIVIVHGPAPELALRRAYGVVVHSEFTRRRGAACALPTLMLDLGASGEPGERGVRLGHNTFSPRKYALSLLSLAQEVLSEAACLRCVDTMGARLNEIGLETGSAVVERVARESYKLFGGAGIKVSLHGGPGAVQPYSRIGS